MGAVRAQPNIIFLMTAGLVFSPVARAQSTAGAAKGGDSSSSTGIVTAELDAESQTKRVQAHRLEQPPDFDGFVNESLWESIPPATGFIQQNPEEGEPSSERTEVRIAFDERHLYFGIICFDSEPHNIVVRTLP